MPLEICIDSLESARNAVQGGADRLEVCSALALGGLTPSIGLARKIREELDVTAYCMLRTRPGDFVADEDELAVLVADCESLKEVGAHGFVFGFLTPEGEVDADACGKLLKTAGDLPSTFHRASDHATDWKDALDRVVQLGFRTILTSGQRPTAVEGLPILQEIVVLAKERIAIMAGSGVNSATLPILVEALPGRRWFHGSAAHQVSSRAPPPSFPMGPADSAGRRVTSVDEVRVMKKILNE